MPLASVQSQTRIERLFQQYRQGTMDTLRPLVLAHYPALYHSHQDEYRKMMELSAKMTVVGHACSAISGYDYDRRRQAISHLFGGCCFLADSFIDDFGMEIAEEYLRRLEVLLTEGWFDIRSPREELFYVVIARLFAERDVLNLDLRQAILLLLRAQQRDVALRADLRAFRRLPRHQQLDTLREIARNRSGHAILVLTRFLVPSIPSAYLRCIFLSGSLIMHIDDHGDHYTDLYYQRVTYMNQVVRPARVLGRMVQSGLKQLVGGLPSGEGRDILIEFLTKYYMTRLKKHRALKAQREMAWAVYE
jgi:hypothetical protein